MSEDLRAAAEESLAYRRRMRRGNVPRSLPRRTRRPAVTRAWWGWATRGKAPESHKTAPVSDSPAVSEQPGRLVGPRGSTVWICLTPSGGKSAWDTEQEALERAKDTTGACVHPVLIEESA